MARIIHETNNIGDFTLQSFDDSEDPFISTFQMEKKEILSGTRLLLSIDIFHDVDDYSIVWNGQASCMDFLSAAAQAHESISTKAKNVGISAPEQYTGRFSLPSEFLEQTLHFPFDALYFDDLAKRGLTFIRLDLPYFDVTADLAPLPGRRQREIGWTSFYQTPEELVTFFLLTITKERRDRYEKSRSDLEQLLSSALSYFRRI